MTILIINNSGNLIGKTTQKLIELKRWRVQFHPEYLEETKPIIYNFLSYCK